MSPPGDGNLEYVVLSGKDVLGELPQKIYWNFILHTRTTMAISCSLIKYLKLSLHAGFNYVHLLFNIF